MTRCTRLILLIDDDSSFREMLRLALEKNGHEIVDASNREEAEAMIEQKRPDVVLANIAMPETESLKIVRALRTRLPQAKIIAMSGGGRASAHAYLREAQAVGANAVLAKPFSSQELSAALEGEADG